MGKFNSIIIFFILARSVAVSQNPLKYPEDAMQVRFSRNQPVIQYLLHIDSSKLSVFEVEIHISHISDTFSLAMFAHPEYDDRFWRYLEDLQVLAKNGKPATIIRGDSSLWHITAPGGEVLVRYKIHCPPYHGRRAVWRPFLSAKGGLADGTHLFMYIPGETLAPSYITLDMPAGWNIATGLESTSDPHVFFAASVSLLMDAPLLFGNLKSWQFSVDGAPHRIVYWPSSSLPDLDSFSLMTGIQKIVKQATALFGRPPYREFFFLFEDSAYGALEHNNSVTIGLPVEELAKNQEDFLAEIAHEYFHTWNLVRIRPAGFGDIGYKTPALSKGLWWGEGLTMFYADLLLRRADLPCEDSSRIAHFEHLMQRYLQNEGNWKLSAEKVSMAANAPPGLLGDYSASTHLQGELIGAALDLIIRDASNGQNSIDDLMRMMFEKYSAAKGFTGKDIEGLTHILCKCDIHPFFEDHVRGNKPIDFNRYLSLIGLHSTVRWSEALDSGGIPEANLRLSAWQEPGKEEVKLLLFDASSCWAKAGLHTGDIIQSVNNQNIPNAAAMRQLIGKLKVGDSLDILVRRPGGQFSTRVIVRGYRKPSVTIREIIDPTTKQLTLKRKWMAAA
jgi:predicted metalloprotease with PDZ domain